MSKIKFSSVGALRTSLLETHLDIRTLAEADYDVPLVVSVSCEINLDSGYSVKLTDRDIIVKLSLELANNLSVDANFCYEHLKKVNGFFFIVLDGECNLPLVNSVKHATDKPVTGNVWQTSDFTESNKEELSRLLLEKVQEKVAYDCTESAEEGALTIIYLGERDTHHSRSWNLSANVFDAIRWTNESGDLHHYIKEPRSVLVVRK